MSRRFFYVKDILKIALPIIFGNLGFIMIGVGDVIIAGRHSTDTLAAVSLANAIIHCITILGIGILGTISPILSNYRGAKKDTSLYFYPSLKFAFILSLIIGLILLAFIPLIDKIGFEQRLIIMIKDYFFVTAFAVFGGYMHFMAKEYLQAHEIVIFPNILTIFCIFLNVGLNIIFAFGYGVIPEMGAKGLAIASLITRYFMGIVLIIYCYKKLTIKTGKVSGYYKDLIKVGMPSSLAVATEFAAFNIIAVLLGRISGIYAAAHNILCTLTSVAFMVPLAISNAISVKVGYCNGAKMWILLRKFAYTGIKMSVLFMFCSAVIIGIFSNSIIRLFTEDAELIKVCTPIIYLLCTYQVFDGLQVTLSGIFRGLKETKIVFIANFFAYWIVSFPIGCLLGLKLKMNLLGFWYSIGISAILLCSIMYAVMQTKFKKLSRR